MTSTLRRVGRFVRSRLPKTKVDHDPTLDVFDHGCWVLTSGGVEMGHVASVLGAFRTPFAPFTKHDWIWLLVVWADGRREMPLEEYSPWHDVSDLLNGEFTHYDGTTYRASRLPDGERQRVWSELGITDGDF